MRRLDVGSPIAIADLEVVPVELTYVRVESTGGVLTAVAAKEPVAIVIRSSQGVSAIDVQGAEASLDALLGEVDGLREWMS